LSIVVGVILFSGSLYVLALTSYRPVAFLTPVGGLFLIAGWVAIIFSFVRTAKQS
jgi:uncharacterized membrane protein YgdD (TMEM256/DUF423 family)